jgi:4-amino-4-deoxy-L-arabinose transferase-like glycosyltransferase
MERQSGFAAWLRRASRWWVILPIALLQFVLHLWVNAHDNFFRDELYYLAAAQHLAPGYVEYPPFVALATTFTRAVFGSSVLAIRLLPALAGASIVVLTADMVAMLGGGLLAQALAAVAIALGPVFIGSSGAMSMDPFDQLWWALTAWLLVRMIQRQAPRMWLGLGIVIGVGLLTKLTIAYFVIALLIGLLLGGQRVGARYASPLLFNRWLFIGGAIAFVLFLPYLVWQAQHGFPVAEYQRIYFSSGKTFQATPPQFFLQQVVTLNPLSLPLWVGGLYFLFFVPAGKPYRAFGWAYLLLFVFFMIQKAKFYWLSPAYPMLIASGAYGLEFWAASVASRPSAPSGLRPPPPNARTKPLPVNSRSRAFGGGREGVRMALLPAYLLLLAISGALLVPFAIPILPPEAFIKLSARLGGAGQIKAENLQSSALPQSYADRYGWREIVGEVKAAYVTLTPAEQAEACVYTSNYGEAGAVDFYGPPLGLPKAISGHNSYFIWGPQGCTGKVIITVNIPLQDLSDSFESVTAAGQTDCTGGSQTRPYCMPYENNAPIFIARGLKAPLDQAWPTVKDFN